MYYTEDLLTEYVTRWGEVFVVLESDREYELHGMESIEFDDRGGDVLVRVEGMRGDDLLKVEFPLDAIEHVYTHREV